MRIDKIVIPERIHTKLEVKHQVYAEEVHDLLKGRPRMRFAEKGHRTNENVYAAFGQTEDGRYLVVYYVFKPLSRTAIVISARDMSRKERKQYGRK